MPLSCDLCGSPLEVQSGGQGAVCTFCGLSYSMARLREKLGKKPDAPAVPPQKKPADPPAPHKETGARPGTQPGWKTGDLDCSDLSQEDLHTGPADPMPREELTPQSPKRTGSGASMAFYVDGALWETGSPNGDFAIGITKTENTMAPNYFRVHGRVLMGQVHDRELVCTSADLEKLYRVEGRPSMGLLGGQIKLKLNTDTNCGRGYQLEAREGDVLIPRQVLLGAPAPSFKEYHGAVEDYFCGLLDRFFPKYEVVRCVRQLAPSGSHPIDLLLRRDGKNALAIFFLTTNEGKTPEVEAAVNACKEQGIHVLSFSQAGKHNALNTCLRIRKTLMTQGRPSKQKKVPVPSASPAEPDLPSGQSGADSFPWPSVGEEDQNYRIRVEQVDRAGTRTSPNRVTITGTVLSGECWGHGYGMAVTERIRWQAHSFTDADRGGIFCPETRKAVGRTGDRVTFALVGRHAWEIRPGDVIIPRQELVGIEYRSLDDAVGPPKHYFAQLFARFFADCQVQQNVRSLGGSYGASADFLISRGNRRVAVLLCDDATFDSVETLALMERCKAQGITPLRFMDRFENHASYICGRIRSYLV